MIAADLAVTVDSTGVRAELRYRLRPAPGAREIPVRALSPAGIRPAAVRAFVWEDPVAFALEPSRPGILEGTVRLPDASRAGDVVDLRLRYRLRGPEGSELPEGGPGGLVRVPVLAVPWPPDEALPGTFTARAALPAGARLEEGFPSAWSMEGGTGAAGPGRYRTELPVLPALVSFRVLSAGEELGGSGRPLGPGTVLGAGFVFWGLFAVFAALVAGYAVWMLREERREGSPGGPRR